MGGADTPGTRRGSTMGAKVDGGGGHDESQHGELAFLGGTSVD